MHGNHRNRLAARAPEGCPAPLLSLPCAAQPRVRQFPSPQRRRRRKCPDHHFDGAPCMHRPRTSGRARGQTDFFISHLPTGLHVIQCVSTSRGCFPPLNAVARQRGFQHPTDNKSNGPRAAADARLPPQSLSQAAPFLRISPASSPTPRLPHANGLPSCVGSALADGLFPLRTSWPSASIRH